MNVLRKKGITDVESTCPAIYFRDILLQEFREKNVT